MSNEQKLPPEYEIKQKVIACGFGLAAEDELSMLARLEQLMIDGIVMGVHLMAERCEQAEQIISKLTADHNAGPNYSAGFELAQQHFARFPNPPVKPSAEELSEQASGDPKMCPPGYVRLIQAADELARREFLPSNCVDDYPSKTMSRATVSRMLDAAHEKTRLLAFEVINGADQMREAIRVLGATHD